jgi:hypothetical protein
MPGRLAPDSISQGYRPIGRVWAMGQGDLLIPGPQEHRIAHVLGSD